jgi:hypothetical protein
MDELTTERTTLGHEMYRTAITALVIKGVFGLAPGHPRLRKCVDDMLRLAESCSTCPGVSPFLTHHQPPAQRSAWCGHTS